MRDVAISMKGVSKRYDSYGSAADILKDWILGGRRCHEFWALRDIDLEVARNEVVGIMGHNGAGKSTLLKLIAGTLARTTGTMQINGRVSAILELGTGFHPDYTGRQNIYFGGLCLGMSREEVRRKEASIIEFSELEEFIDQPFRTYSSGMQARLTFSTAVAIDPDILIVDEALAVGDARFQKKCADRMRSLAGGGRTVLLVSHNHVAIMSMCSRAILLHKGRKVEDGDPRSVFNAYQRFYFGPGTETAGAAAPLHAEMTSHDMGGAEGETRFGTGKVRITEIQLTDFAGRPVTVLEPGNRYRFRMTAIAHEPVSEVIAGFLLRDPRGLDIFGTDSLHLPGHEPPAMAPGDRYEFVLDFENWLGPGEYLLSCGLAGIDEKKHDFRWDTMTIACAQDPSIYTICKANLRPTMQVHVQRATLTPSATS